MQINQINNNSVYDASGVRMGRAKEPANIVEEISENIQSGSGVKPFKAGTYRITGKNSDFSTTVNQTNKLISSIATTLSDKRADGLILRGFDLDNMSIKSLADLIEKGDNTALKGANKNLAKADKYMRALKEKDLPINDSNMNKLKRGYDVYEKIKTADRSKRLSVLSSVYKKGGSSLKCLGAAMKLPPKTKPVSMSEDKIKTHLDKLFIKSDEKNIGLAKDLLSVNVPVNKKNMDFLSGSNSMLSDAKTLGDIAMEISKMGSGLGADIAGLGDEEKAKNADLVDKVQSIDDNDINKAAQLGKTKSIKEVLATRESDAKGENAGEAGAKSEASLRREIEEVRLKLNIENAAKLEKAGINPETEELSKLVERLRELEKEELKKDMRLLDKKVSDGEITSVYSDKLVVEKLKFIRADFRLNLEEKSDLSLENFSATTSLKAVDKYLLTEIRSDLGDSVVKSFAGIEDRLKSLGLDASETRIMACKSLIRSGLDVTAENISRVELVSERLDFLTKNLTPETLLKINRAGIDIKTLPIDEAVDLTKLYQSDGAENKLARLIAKADIADADYKDIMATYKAIYKGLKKDGVAVANLIKSGADINIKNLKIFSGYKGYSENINKILDESTGLNENAKASEKSPDLVDLEKLLVQFRLAKVVKNLTGENIKTMLAGSEREQLSFEDLARVLESELGEKEYFDGKTGEIVKKLIELKIPVTFSNIDKAKKLARNSFNLIDEIAAAVDEIDNEEEKARVSEELKRLVSEKINKKEDLESALMELKADVDSEEFAFKERFETAIKDVNFADEMEELFFQLPYLAGGEFKQLNIFSKEKQIEDDEEVEVVLALKTKAMGEKQINLSILENRISLFVKVENEKEKASFSVFKEDFERAVKSAGFYFAGMNFSKLDGEKEEVAEIADDSIISFRI